MTKGKTMHIKSYLHFLFKLKSVALMGAMGCMVLLTSCKEKEAPVTLTPVEQFAAKINFKCPFMVDSDTRMDSVHILPDSTFQYNYTLVNQVRDRIDIGGLTAFIGAQLQETVQHSSTMKFHRDHELRMIFYYRDRNGDFVTQIIMEPENYQ